jgi:4-amino-4-deoxy-L-arabinose transferase-like glycosyltransferase
MTRRLTLPVLVAVALGFRLLHLSWGLPDVFEEATPFFQAWRFWQWEGAGITLAPNFFNYPALTFYVQFVAQALHYALGHVTGAYADLAAFRAAFERDPTASLVLARGITALFDVGTVALVFLLGRRFMGEPAAALAAALVAVNPLHIRQAQMVGVDAPLTFFVVAALFVVSDLQRDGRARRYALAGMVIGLAASTKYTGALLLGSVVAVHLVAAPTPRAALSPRLLVRPLLAATVALIVFLALNPFVLLSRAGFLRDFGFEQYHMSYGHFGLDTGTPTPLYYLREIVPQAGAILLLGAACVGVLVLVRGKGKESAPLLVWVLLSGGMLLTWKMRADRYALPLVPVLALFAAAGVSWMTARIHAALHRRLAVATGLTVILVLALTAEPLARDLEYYRSAELPDTRETARQWIEQALPAGSVVVMAPLGLTLKDPLITFPLPYRSVRFEEFAPFYDLRWYQDLDMVVGSSFDLARYRQEPARFSSFLRYFYDSLETRWTPVARLDPVHGQRGPAIALFVPQRAAALEPLDAELFERLAGIQNVSMVKAFSMNLANVLTAKGRHDRAAQVLTWLAADLARRGRIADAAAVASDKRLRAPAGSPAALPRR